MPLWAALAVFATSIGVMSWASVQLTRALRTPTEWKSNHIERAYHLPLSAFAERVTDVPNDRPIAVICGSGYRSSIAASLLQARGYKEVENVTGGMTAFGESP